MNAAPLPLLTSLPLLIEMRSIDDLVPFDKNARTHSKRQIRQIADSITSFGFTNPVLLSSSNNIVAGHGRVRAARLLGMTEVPTILLAHLSADEIRAYVIADNKLALNAGWDTSILAIELQYLMTIETDFEITVTGFEVPEIDMLVLEAVQIASEPEDPLVDPAGPPVSRTGDLWALDEHRILCGNSLEESSFQKVLDGKLADMILADPPYGVRIDGHASGNGATKHREFAMGCGEMSGSEFEEFLIAALKPLARHSKPGSMHFVFMSWHHLQELLGAGKQVYGSLLNIVVWAKDRAGMGSLYRSQHEMCPVFRNGKEQHRNNIQLGRFGRNRTNIWEYPSAQSTSKASEEADLLSLHPTIKPTSMLADAILDCTAIGDLVLDSFLGSGSTLLAAERVRRSCYGIEIDPLYVDLAIRRWERYTGRSAIHADSGKSFQQLTAEREVSRG